MTVDLFFGKNQVQNPLTDGRRSWEGTASMLAVSFLAGLVTLTAAGSMPLAQALPLAGVGAVLGAATELFSPSEWDTVTVPVVIAAVLLVLSAL